MALKGKSHKLDFEILRVLKSALQEKLPWWSNANSVKFTEKIVQKCSSVYQVFHCAFSLWFEADLLVK